MLDVHIAVIPTVSSAWLAQCLDTVRSAADAAPFPVSVHVFDGVVGNIGESRAIGYGRGDAKYVTYVDCDDYVLPDAFSPLNWTFGENPRAVFTQELTRQNGHLRRGSGRHHLAVYRRDTLAGFGFSAWPACVDLALQRRAEAHPDGVIDVLEAVYVHRLYVSEGRKLRRINSEELIRARHG